MFSSWRNVSEAAFFTDPLVIGDFKNYIQKLLTHKNKYTGIPYGLDPTVLAFETGNEIRPPSAWTANITAFIKSISPDVLTVDGTNGVQEAVKDIPTVDIVSQHYYPMDPSKMQGAIGTATRIGKAFLAGEFGWDKGNLTAFLEAALAGTGTPESSTRGSPAGGEGRILRGTAADDDSAAPPALFAANFWSFFPHADSHGFVPHGDHYTMHYPGDSESMRAGVW